MFNLPFLIPPAPVKISLKDVVFSIGSCFADNIGEYLTRFKFDALHNPFGVIYNPSSICQLLTAVNNQEIDLKKIVEHQEVYYHWDTHSRISSTRKADLIKLLNQTISSSHKQLKSSNWLIVTLGTAHVYRLLENGLVVANCHKVPQKQFKKHLLNPAEIIEQFKETFTLLKTSNPSLKIILTVSPVRHVRDGLVENNLSKSILIHAVQELVKQLDNVHYFPAYEIVIDVLRDYRFYKEDMIHPSNQAVAYIWEQFTKSFMDDDTEQFIKSWTSIQNALNHRTFHPETTAHQAFLKTTIKKLESMAETINVQPEISYLKQQLL